VDSIRVLDSRSAAVILPSAILTDSVDSVRVLSSRSAANLAPSAGAGAETVGVVLRRLSRASFRLND
jgi:hypothetical protein